MNIQAKKQAVKDLKKAGLDTCVLTLPSTMAVEDFSETLAAGQKGLVFSRGQGKKQGTLCFGPKGHSKVVH